MYEKIIAFEMGLISGVECVCCSRECLGLSFKTKCLITQRSRRSICLSGWSLCPAISWMGDVWHSLWVKPAHWEKVKHSLKARSHTHTHTRTHGRTHTPHEYHLCDAEVYLRKSTPLMWLSEQTQMKNSNSGLTSGNHIWFLCTWSLAV